MEKAKAAWINWELADMWYPLAWTTDLEQSTVDLIKCLGQNYQKITNYNKKEGKRGRRLEHDYSQCKICLKRLSYTNQVHKNEFIGNIE